MEARRAGCRGGHRSALDIFGPGPRAFCHSVVRRRQNSWWKCRRSPDIHWRSLPCVPWGGGLPRHWRSRSWTIQFLRVGERERFSLRTEFISECGMWSRPLMFLLVEVSKVFSQARGSSSSRFLQDEDEGSQGGSSDFSPAQKNAKVTRQVESQSFRQWQLIRGECSSSGSRPASLMSWRMNLAALLTLLLRTLTGEVEAAVAVLSRLTSRSGQCMQLWSSTVQVQ